MKRYTEYVKYKSGRQAVFRFLAENPRHTFTSLKHKLSEKTIFGDLKDQTIRNYISEYRQLYPRFGTLPRFHRGFGVLRSGFDAGLWEVAPSFGWRVSRNRNRERLWSESGISLGWHRNGTVVFRFKGFRPEGHLLSAFARAFRRVLLSSDKDEREVIGNIHALFKKRYRMQSFHSTYETCQPLPRFTVKDLEKSHGIVIKMGDGSHPTSLEIEQSEPFWFCKIENVIDQLGDQIESHLALIKSWREESIENKRGMKQLVSRLLEFFQRLEKKGVFNGI